MSSSEQAFEVARGAFLARLRFSLRLHLILTIVALGILFLAGTGLALIFLDRALSESGGRFSDLAAARRIVFFMLAGSPVVAGLPVWLLYRRTVRPLRRFVEHADRIAGGDHTPLTPVRRYRDEFTDLALSLNRMILEIERRQAEDVKSAKLQSIGLLASGVAHELNNPLQNILLTAHGLLEEQATMPEADRIELLRDVVKESERACRIIRNLLDFARESQREKAPLSLKDLAEGALWFARSDLGRRGVAAKVEADGWLPPVSGNRDQLVQVLLNLVVNAADVTPAGGEILVVLARSEDPAFCVVKVVDRGPGIPPHVLPHIFEPFFTTKARGKGTGIGLAVSQAIVRRHGGSISVETREGEGTTFLVRLPAVRTPPEPPERT